MMMNKPHKHAEVIKAWADGVPVQFLSTLCTPVKWEDLSPTAVMAWREDCQYRIKPKPTYPKSTLDYGALCQIVNQATLEFRAQRGGEGYDTILTRMAADAAVAEFIRSGEINKWKENN